MILRLMALCIVAMRAFPETPIARWLNTALIEQPVAWLSNIRRRDIIFLFVLIALLLVANDVIMLFGVSELISIGASLSIYFDAVLISAAVTISAAAATAWRGLRARLSTSRGAASQRRPRAARQSNTPKTQQPKALDDEDGLGWRSSYAV